MHMELSSTLTDDFSAAIRVQSWMRGRQDGRYHVKHNNCQHFVEELWRRLCISGHGVEADSLRSLGTVASKFSIQVKYDEKETPSLSGITIRVDDCSESSFSLGSVGCDAL